MKNIPAEIYSHRRTVAQEDLDELQHVNNVRYVQWMEDIAKEHWDVRATKQLKEDFLWVVVRHEIDYKKQAVLDDEVLIETFVGDTTFVTSERYVNIKKAATGELLVASKSIWCLLDINSKRPTKITEELREVFHKQEGE